MERNLTIHRGSVGRAERERLLGQKGCVVWFTGLSGSGKSTIARAVEQRLAARGRLAYVLDGDNLRYGLNGDLGFSPAEREENIRRAGEVAALFADAGVVTLVAFISPYRGDRERARGTADRTLGEPRFVEIHLCTPLDVCELRDPKGLYAKARAGEIAEFTGVSAPYEPPDRPELRIDTGRTGLAGATDLVLAALAGRGFVPDPDAEGVDPHDAEGVDPDDAEGVDPDDGPDAELP